MDNVSAITEVMPKLDYNEEDIELDLSNFSEEEIKRFIPVLKSDRDIRKEENKRKRQLENTVEQKIIEIDSKNIDNGVNYCIICAEKFRILINPRLACKECEKGMCSGCGQIVKDSHMICTLCYMKNIKAAKTGQWFVDASKSNDRLRVPATAVLNRSLRKKTKSVELNISLNNSPHLTISEDTIDSSPYNSFKNKHEPIYKSKASSMKLQKENSSLRGTSITKEKPVDVVDSGSINNLNESNDVKLKSNHLQSNLQQSQSLAKSSVSLISDTEESYQHGIPISGNILFSVSYDNKCGRLIIYIDQCKNLPVADVRKRETNPYIKTYLLPDKTKASKRKSTSKRCNFDPMFKETLYYNIPKEKLKCRILSVAVWHKNILFYSLFLGEVHIQLADIDLNNKESTWYPLQDKIKYTNRSGHIFVGELIIKLKYNPSARKNGKGALHVFVVGAQQLQTEGRQINAYLTGYLLPNKSMKSKQKTDSRKSDNNINWNRLLQFSDVTLEDLKDRSLELALYHKNKFKFNEFLGGVRLNLGLGLHSSDHVSWMDAQGAEQEAWENFLSNPNEYTEAILNLRPNLDY